jgi:hypothetical protein
MPISPTYLHKMCHSVIFAGRLASLRGRAWTERTRSLPGGGQPRELGAFPGEPSLVQTRQCRGCQHGSPRRFDDGVDAAVCPRQFQKS